MDRPILGILFSPHFILSLEAAREQGGFAYRILSRPT